MQNRTLYDCIFAPPLLSFLHIIFRTPSRGCKSFAPPLYRGVQKCKSAETPEWQYVLSKVSHPGVPVKLNWILFTGSLDILLNFFYNKNTINFILSLSLNTFLNHSYVIFYLYFASISFFPPVTNTCCCCQGQDGPSATSQFARATLKGALVGSKRIKCVPSLDASEISSSVSTRHEKGTHEHIRCLNTRINKEETAISVERQYLNGDD